MMLAPVYPMPLRSRDCRSCAGNALPRRWPARSEVPTKMRSSLSMVGKLLISVAGPPIAPAYLHFCGLAAAAVQDDRQLFSQMNVEPTTLRLLLATRRRTPHKLSSRDSWWRVRGAHAPGGRTRLGEERMNLSPASPLANRHTRCCGSVYMGRSGLALQSSRNRSAIWRLSSWHTRL